MAVRSRLPQIAAELAAQMDAAARVVANRVEAQAKDRAPVATGKLRDSIHVERQGFAEYAVIAGDNDAFYGHIVENGSVHVPPHPFLVPATEATRDDARKLFMAALRRL